VAPSFEALRHAVLAVAQKGIKLQRFKGLGEMDAEQLGETTMSPTTRTLAQVTLEDAFAADRIFSMLILRTTQEPSSTWTCNRGER
jgi:DNA gyrase subunit B